MLAGSLVVAAATPDVPSVERRSDACESAPVHFTHHPGLGRGLGDLPWIAGEPASQRLVGLLWYWPESWRADNVTRARIYAGGHAPGPQATTPNMKILWVFLAPAAKRDLSAGRLVIKGRRLDGPGKSWQQFTAIGYSGQNGAPSYASIVDLPTPGCWRVSLTAGGLHATTTIEALPVTG